MDFKMDFTEEQKLELRKFLGFSELTPIGSGAYGRVYKGNRESDGKEVAVKIIENENKQGYAQNAMREIDALKRLQEDYMNVLTLYDVKPGANFVAIVTDYMGSDMHKFLANQTENLAPYQLQQFIVQLFNGMSFIHSKGIVHRDIKPSNILINHYNLLKFADFGLARVGNHNVGQAYTPAICTIWYRPIELVFGAYKYGYEIDVWSLACVCYELATRQVLFRSNVPLDAIQNQSRFDKIRHLHEILNLVGEVNEENWPGVTALLLYNNYMTELRNHNKTYTSLKAETGLEKNLADNGCPPDAELVKLLADMLKANPSDRQVINAYTHYRYFRFHWD